MAQTHGVFGKYGILIEQNKAIAYNNIKHVSQFMMNTSGDVSLMEAFGSGCDPGYGPGYMPNHGLAEYLGWYGVRSKYWGISYSRYPGRAEATIHKRIDFWLNGNPAQYDDVSITLWASSPHRASHHYNGPGNCRLVIRAYSGSLLFINTEISNAIYMGRGSWKRSYKNLNTGVVYSVLSYSSNYNYMDYDQTFTHTFDLGYGMATKIEIDMYWYHGSDSVHDVGDRSPDKSWNDDFTWGRFKRINANWLPFNNYNRENNFTNFPVEISGDVRLLARAVIPK